MGEAQYLRAVLNSGRIALMSSVRTTAVDLGNIIGFTPVHIPRLVTWGDVGEILGLLDLLIVNRYSEQVSSRPERHLNPLRLVDSHSLL